MMSEEKESFGLGKMTGGPKGYGDPDDRSLRRIEKEVMIPKIIRERAKTEKCSKLKQEFDQCCLTHGPLFFVECREINTAFKACVHEWFTNPQFYNECQQIYLEKRAEFRRTGVKTKQQPRGHKAPKAETETPTEQQSS